MRLPFLPVAVLATLSMAACILDREGGLADDPASGGGTATGVGGSGTGSGVEVGGSGTGTNAGTNTGTPGGSTSGTMTGMPGPEDCQNGVDDDGDMLVDCADDDCMDYTCVAEPPVDWSVPSYVVTNTFPGPSIGCPDGGAPEVLFEGPGEAASCSACSCDEGPLDCSSPTVGCWFNSSDCSGSPTSTYNPNSCANLPSCTGSCGNPQRCGQISNSQLTGQCTPTGGMATLSPIWQAETTICASPTQGGGCGANQICVPVVPMDFDPNVCVRRTGDETCPSGYPNKRLHYEGGTDDRACQACGCDESGVSCTPGTSSVHDGDLCTFTEYPLGTCTDVTEPLDGIGASVAVSPGTMSGTCTPTGGQPTGSVTPTGPVTLCCP